MPANYWDRWKQDDDDDPYVRFDTPGLVVEGTIVKLGSTTFGGGETVPVMTLETEGGRQKIVNVSQRVLLRRVVELGPEVGDIIRIEYLGEAAKSTPGRNPAKLFEVDVQYGGKGGPRVPETWGGPRPQDDAGDPF